MDAGDGPYAPNPIHFYLYPQHMVLKLRWLIDTCRLPYEIKNLFIDLKNIDN